MEQRICKNKRCQRPLPDSWKYKYCEHCRTTRAKQVKDLGASALGLVVTVGGIVLSKGSSKK